MADLKGVGKKITYSGDNPSPTGRKAMPVATDPLVPSP